MSQLNPLLGKRVLIVEEDDGLYAALTGSLRDAGCETYGAVGAPGSSVFLMPRSRIDAAVLDLNFRHPAANRLVDELTERGVPVILVANDRPVHATYHLSKPFTEQELLDGVAQAIASSQITPALPVSEAAADGRP